ncbi:hypothetical protein [Actinospica sp.]|jgi:hypothetical protein|uniref:hypothetical protein n=1 Tax=Actinospica sp. TaxID=1872142 RepID=UPI002BC3FE19|nr:hypothetical protein [Actinospica sp.]HWG24106.1 hypothetical protein [Actinospica sp.]
MDAVPAGSLAPVASTSSGPAVGLALGSGYQSYFATLSSSAQQSEISRMKAANIAWVRMDADWNDIQNPKAGDFDFSVPNATASVLLAAGMNLDILLYESPVWARLAAGATSLNGPWPTPDPALYADYCAAAAGNFSAMGVHTFELWNEPNLDSGVAPAPKLGTPSGWGYLSPLGFADLAVAAYPRIKAADPQAFVLGGTLANHDEYGYGGTVRSASWAQISAGSATAQINCAAAASTDLYMLIADANSLLPAGTYVTAVQPGVGYTVAPPAWQTTFTNAVASVSSSSPVTVHLCFGYAPELFLTQAYARAAGRPMWDALAIHPYTQPYLPASQPVDEGGFTAIPALRNIMVANGESAKPMWITEIGGATGRASAVWPATAGTATSLAVTSPNAATDDVHYELVADGVPSGSFVSAATAGGGWTVLPPTGLVLSTALTSGTAITGLTVAATKVPLTIPAGTLVKVTVAPGDASGVTAVVKTTTTTAVTPSTTAETTIVVSSVTPTADYPVGSVIQASVGQTFGTAVPAGAHVIVYVYPPGVAQNGAVSEATQADIITQTFTAIETGVPADSGTGVVGAGPWPYVQAVFVYCWSDAGGTAGPFGLTRADGSSKPALAALTTAAA